MRNSAIVLLAGVFVLGAGIAQANDDHRRREHEFKLECKYIGGEVVRGKKGGGIIPHACTVEARFCRSHGDGFDRVAADLGITNDDGDSFCRDGYRDRANLKVECDDRIFFRDRAFIESFGGYEFIRGINESPVLKVPLDQFLDDDRRDDRDNGRSRAHVVNSWLRVGDHVLDGFCAVKERRDNDRDHHDAPRPAPLQ